MGLALLLMLLATNASAQRATDGATPLALSPGAPAGSYSLSGFDNVNLYNGNLGFQLPLLGVGGRGAAQHNIMLLIKRKWAVLHSVTPDDIHTYDPVADWWTNNEPVMGGGMFGPGRIVGRHGTHGKNDCHLSNNPTDDVYRQTLTRLTFIGPNGTEFELRDELSGGMKKVPVCSGPGFSRGRVFVSADGSAMTFISDTEIVDEYRVGLGDPFYPSGYLLLRDGTRYRFNHGTVEWIRDRNGNLLTFSYGTIGGQSSMTITDSLNRQVTVSAGLNIGTDTSTDITYKGFGGQPRTIRIINTDLTKALRSDQTPKTAKDLFPELDGNNTTPFNMKVIGSVVLPDGRSYVFKYNSYAELARVEMPTGAAIEYDYAAGFRNNNADGVVSFGYFSYGFDYQVYRRVVARRVYPNGGTDWETETTYSRPESRTPNANTTQNDGYVEVAEKYSTGTLLSVKRHYFNGNAGDSLNQGYFDAVSYPTWNEGREYKTEWYDTDGQSTTTLLKRVERTWQEGMPLSANPTAKVNARIVETITTLYDVTPALVSKQTAINPSNSSIVGFDQHNNPTDLWEYDYGPGAPGALKRHTQTSYVTNNGGTSYDTLIFNGATPDVPGSIHIRSLPSQQSVYNASGIERARTTYEYDNYVGGDNKHEPLKNQTSISGLCTQHTAAGVCSNSSPANYLTRGNSTGVTSYLLAANGSVIGSMSTYQQYDIAGNVIKVIDANNNETSFDFSDRFGVPDGEARANDASQTGGQMTYAFASSVTNALGHTAYMQYDYHSGKAVNIEDINGVVSGANYGANNADKLDRPSQQTRAINTPAQSQTTFTYDDANLTITTQSDLNSAGDKIKSQILFDNLGRTIETRSFEPDGTYIAVQRLPFVMVQNTQGRWLRGARVSNPYRAGEPLLWTTTAFDAQGRGVMVKTPDNSVDSTHYHGTRVLVTDQAGKQRLSQTNALGHLTDVWEITAADSATVPVTFLGQAMAGYLTHYDYDTLGNVTTVTQQVGTQGTTQTRTFTYDSLSRLTSAYNPERGTIAYDYYPNGNLWHKTDARGIITTYAYDALNRNTSRSYTNDPAQTPGVTYSYDTPGIAYAKGRLTTISSSASQTNYVAFDALGRITASSQKTDGQAYSMSYEYDLAGNLTTEIYPTGRVIRHTFDAAGRLQKVEGTKGSAAPLAYATVNQYAAHGAIKQMTLGNGLVEQTSFNSRLQPEEIKLGSSVGSPTDKLSLQYNYGTTTNNGNVLLQTITVPGMTHPIIQNYEYDKLNRLSLARENNNGTQSWQQVYSYDRFGNRRLKAGTTIPSSDIEQDASNNPTINPANNRIDVGQGYGYDDGVNNSVGNLTSAPGYNYSFDAENRIIKSNYAAPNQQVNDNTYIYDGSGHRIKKVAANGQEVTVFVYNAMGQMVAEYNNLAPTTANKTSYLTTDTLGTPRVITDTTGAVKSRHDYLPFGEEIGNSIGGRSADQQYGSDDGVHQKFTHKERDGEIGLDYFGARYYSSARGRFTSTDPVFGQINRPQTWNAYNYAANNPINRVDPDGARDVPAYVRNYVLSNLKPMLQTALAANVSGAAVFAIGAWETRWGQEFAYKVKNNPAGLSTATEKTLSFPNMESGYARFTIMLCATYKRAAGIHDPYKFLATIQDDNGLKYNSRTPEKWLEMVSGLVGSFGLDFFDDAVLSPLRNGQSVKFNGVTVSSTEELDRLLNSSLPEDQLMASRFLNGVYGGWEEHVRNIGTEKDPNVKKIRRAFSLPGSSNPMAEAEALYEYRLGQTTGRS
jgi:RHS repeat-associated protein